jgi:hypothetical protein
VIIDPPQLCSWKTRDDWTYGLVDEEDVAIFRIGSTSVLVISSLGVHSEKIAVDYRGLITLSDLIRQAGRGGLAETCAL